MLFTFIFYLVPRLQQPSSSQQQKGSVQQQYPPPTTPQNYEQQYNEGQAPTRYFSWLPHGEFAEQHEAFRNAIRIAYETKRIMVAPKLRLGHPYPWQPFDQLKRRYEAQDKQVLRELCRSGREDWRTQLEPCETLDEWMEISWSSLFNLRALEEEFGVRVMEWPNPAIPVDQGVVVDPMSYAANGSSIEHGAIVMQPAEPLTSPLKKYLSSNDLIALDAPFIQFGALSSAARYKTRHSKGQSALRRALNSRLFVTPDQLRPLSFAADQISEALGGRSHYSALHLNLRQQLERSEHSPQKVMEASVMEIFGDIPINQAVSAAMLVQPSRLADMVNHTGSQELLDACVEYRNTIDKRYPIYYLVNDVTDDPKTQLDLFGPLYRAFPCVFSKKDLMQWGRLNKDWAADIKEEEGDPRDTTKYEDVLAPILDILVASRAYSFFEIPQTGLTRFMAWQPKH